MNVDNKADMEVVDKHTKLHKKIRLVTKRKKFFKTLGVPKNQFSTVEESLEDLGKLDIIQNDTETTGLGFDYSKLHCIQLGTGKLSYVVDLKSIDIQKYKDLLETKTNIFHNAAFDLTFYLKEGIRILKVWDTMLAAQLIHCGMKGTRNGLFYELKLRLGIEISKDERMDVITEGIDTLHTLNYSGIDTIYLHKLRKKQIKKLKELDLERVHELECKFACVLAYMEFCGIYLDRDAWMKRVRKAEYEEYKAMLELNDFIKEEYPQVLEVYPELNWSAPMQALEVFKLIGGIDVTDAKTGKETVDAKVLGRNKDSELVAMYLDLKQKEKVVGTYGRNWFDYIGSDKRIHTKVRQIMETGRTSSGNVKSGPFPNMQNVPSDIETRGCFRGQSGRVFVVCDYSSQESVILADKSKEKNLLKFYKKGMADMHSYVAQQVWPELKKLTGAEVKEKHSDKRKLAKSAGFAITYGGNGYTIANNLNISQEEGTRVYEAYLKAFPGLKRYFEAQKKKVLRQGFILVNPVSGRKRFIPRFKEWRKDMNDREFWAEYKKEKAKNSAKYKTELLPKCKKIMSKKSGMERDALNTPIQGTAADMSKEAAVMFYEWLCKSKARWGKIKIVNFIHDEWVIECAKGKAEVAGAKLSECMVKAADKYLTVLNIKAEPVITDKWDH